MLGFVPKIVRNLSENITDYTIKSVPYMAGSTIIAINHLFLGGNYEVDGALGIVMVYNAVHDVVKESKYKSVINTVDRAMPSYVTGGGLIAVAHISNPGLPSTIFLDVFGSFLLANGIYLNIPRKDAHKLQ